MPLFSTIIPVFNRPALIRTTLDSVLAQEFTDQEIIVVDDGSTDDTPATLATYGDRIRVLRQANAGPAVARNLGMRHATGRYLAILDSDDLWFPWTLATYAEAIRSAVAPAFIAGAHFIFHEESAARSIARGPVQTVRFADYLASSGACRWISASAFVLRTDAARAVGGFSDEWINSDDADLALRLGTAAGFVDVQSPATFAYREHPGSLKSNQEMSFRSLSHMLDQEAAGAYPGGLERRCQRREILTRHVRPLTLSCLAAGAIGHGWSLYRRTFGWHLAQGRLKYLGAYPLLTVGQSLGLNYSSPA